MPKFILTIKTNSYVGNFDRDLAAYCFGWFSEFVDEAFREAFRKEEGNIIDLPLFNFYDEHGPTCFEIDANCNNLLIYFNKNPKKYLDLIKRRLLAFPKVYVNESIKIKGISLSEEITTEKLILEEAL